MTFSILRRSWLYAAIAVTFWVAAATPATPASATQPASQGAPSFVFMPILQNGPAPLCRFGVNGTVNSQPVKDLRLSWYLDYGASRDRNPKDGISYFPMIRLEQVGNTYAYSAYTDRRDTSEAELKAIIADNPGKHWFIGNEPDRIQYQDELEPQIYAEAYHDLYTLIKAEDPTAKIVAGAIVQPTPVRIQYLDLVLAAYQARYQTSMPVDAWAFHNFILNEVSCEAVNKNLAVCWGADIPPGVNATQGLRIEVKDTDRFDLFEAQVWRFRRWMADRGYQNVPAFLSEFGVLMPAKDFPEFDVVRVNSFMDSTFDFLLNTRDSQIGYPADDYRLVQRFAWYSMEDDETHNGNLFDPVSRKRTPMGDNFARNSGAQRDEIDLFPLSLKQIGPVLGAGAGSATVTLGAVIANSGNLAAPTQTEVRFYKGNPTQGGTLIGDASTVAIAGCGEHQKVQVEWRDVTPGTYQIYVQVDGSNQHSEIDENNNLLGAEVTVSP